MTLLLCAPDDVDLRPIAAALERRGVASRCLTLPRAESLPAVAGAGVQPVLVFPGSGVVPLGELVSRLRAALPAESALQVCCRQLTTSDRQTVTRCGASSIISPSDWDGVVVAERIQAELIAGGAITPSVCGGLQGATGPMQRVYQQIGVVAGLAETILIRGETGTGKELVAREIHRQSGHPGSLLAINCAALSPELVESELFGHERGAFSGAVSQRKGLLSEAGAGTVFLDEIGDLGLPAQAKLLRVLEERAVRPVGANRWVPIQARILLATHRDLEEASRERQFRQDLFERIRGFTITLPPLRERRADLALLAQFFLDEYNINYGGARTLPPGCVDALFRYDWPGNVRELRQAVRQAAAYAANDRANISALHLLEAAQSRGSAGGGSYAVHFDPRADTWRAVQDRVRTAYFRGLLTEAEDDKEVAATRAGISRSQLYEILRQLDEA